MAIEDVDNEASLHALYYKIRTLVGVTKNKVHNLDEMITEIKANVEYDTILSVAQKAYIDAVKTKLDEYLN